MKVRKSITLPVREQYKPFPIKEHTKLISMLSDVYGFELVKFLRTRDTYMHTYRYELKFVKYVNGIPYEFKMNHDAYMTDQWLWADPSIKGWLLLTNHPIPPKDNVMHFEMQSLVAPEAAAREVLCQNS